MNAEPNPPPVNEPRGKKRISALALPLAFVPSVLLLAFFTGFGSSNPPAALFIAFCGISIVSCFASAILLFCRRTVLAVFFWHFVLVVECRDLVRLWLRRLF